MPVLQTQTKAIVEIIGLGKNPSRNFIFFKPVSIRKKHRAALFLSDKLKNTI